MMSLYSYRPFPSTKALQFSSSFILLSPQNPKSLAFRISGIFKASSISSSAAKHQEPVRTNFAGVQVEETVDDSNQSKLRLDSWISSRIQGISRARVQSSIKSGLVTVNGRVVDKVSYNLRAGDKVNCVISDLQPLKAESEDIPLDIVFEDDHVLVVNKPPHMVVHPAPGNATGTLVNGILHHCSLPTLALSEKDVLLDTKDVSDDEEAFCCGASASASVRPGIVHRLDKGTSGLLVVAKDEHSHAHLSEQFKQHTIQRVYISLTCGVPSASAGRVDVPIGRDSKNRVRMVAGPGLSYHGQARHAASRYKVIEVLAAGGSALVQWRLETGRTHQIRAHAKYIGIPLLGDEVYGGTRSMALSLLRPRIPPNCNDELSRLVFRLERPCLHALVLGFEHPHSREKMQFSCPPPPDFSDILNHLRKIGIRKVCAALVQIISVNPSLFEPHLKNVIEFMLQANKDADDEVALEACEFWSVCREVQLNPGLSQEFLEQLIPVLLSNMVYADDEASLFDAEEDESVPDRD